jgi:hypothetical protein
MMLFFFMVALARRSGIVYGTVLVGAEGDETVGIVGAVAGGAIAPNVGGAFVMGTVDQELTPRLPISVESNGIPLGAPGVEAEVGLDDAVTVLESAPHIPDNPAVTVVPEIPDSPEVADIPDGVVPDVAGAMDAVAGEEVPFSVTPPPS